MERLCELAPGDAGLVRGLETRGSMRRRLLELGLVEGTRVECVGRAPWGDPAAYRIRGAVIALRRTDANGILLTGAEPWA